MENKSSNGWKFFALLFGALLAGVVGLYIYKQQNPDYDPWEEPWENSSSPVDLGLTKDAEPEADATAAVRSARTFGHYRHTQSDMRKTYEKALGKSQGPSSSSLIRPLRNGRSGSDHACVGDASDVS